MTHWRAKTNVRTDLGGNEHPFARYRANTQRDPYPLPARSIRSDGFSSDGRTRERAALSFAVVFFSLAFAIPLILAGIMMHSR